jgi:alkanesulfonate monooxygenase SsuD/methylene tetrahydromethanopterin reductase-like flavin-dependent oxidoreductase (luciferase family)
MMTMHELHFGLKPALQSNSVAALRRQWAIADDAGFDTCWGFDHFAALGPDRSVDIFEAWTMLAAMAEATDRVRIGTMVTGNSHRHPGMLAKMAVTVDHLSGGRLEMGIGAGGDEMVHDMFGLPLGPARERVEALGEACRILELLWSEPATSFSGRHYRLDGAIANPKPVQRPRPPLWVASSGERLGLRVVAEHGDVWINANLPGEDPAELVRLRGVLDRHCEAIGRDPDTIRRAVQLRLPDEPDEALRTVERYVSAGFSEVIFMIYAGGDAAVAASEAAAELLPKLRSLG